MTKQPKVRKPHPVLHGIGLVLSVILLVAVLVGTYLLSTMLPSSTALSVRPAAIIPKPKSPTPS